MQDYTTIDKIKEWTLCLVSKSHAESTWLRVESKTERTAHMALNGLIVGLMIATAIVWHGAYVKYQHIQELKRYYQTKVVELEQS